MTLFSEILRGLGLSQREAADFLGVRLDTIKGYSSPARPQRPPAGILAELHALAERQEAAAEEALEVWEEAGSPDEIEIGLASDDHEARALGWPCVGAHLAVIRRMWELLPPGVRVIVVPRGSTPATAAAADAHEK